MKIVVFVLSAIIGIKTISYGIYEISKNNNRFGGIFVISLAIISAILPNICIWIMGI